MLRREVKLNEDSRLDIMRLFYDEEIRKSFLQRDGQQVFVPQHIEVKKNGTIVLGKYPYKLVNRLMGTEEHVPFASFKDEIIEMVTRKISDGDTGKEINFIKEAHSDIIGCLYEKHDYDLVVKNLYLFWFLGVYFPEKQRSVGSSPRNKQQHQNHNKGGDKKVIIEEREVVTVVEKPVPAGYGFVDGSGVAIYDIATNSFYKKP